MLKLRFSKSKILEYNNCPRKYYLQNFTILGKNRPDEEPDYLIDGKYLHSYFEAYNQGDDSEKDFDMYSEFIQNNVNGFHSLLNRNKLDKAIYSELKHYDEDLDFVFIVDAIYEDEKGIKWLIDYKTGKYYAPKRDTYMYELYLYVYFIEKHLNITIDKGGFFFTNYPKQVVEKIDRTKLKDFFKKFLSDKEKILKCDFPRNPNRLCGWCNFRFSCCGYRDEIITD